MVTDPHEPQIPRPAPAFSVCLVTVGPATINVIRAVRQVTGLGLREAKELVDGAPTVVMTCDSAEAANVAMRQLAAAGAHVDCDGVGSYDGASQLTHKRLDSQIAGFQVAGIGWLVVGAIFGLLLMSGRSVPVWGLAAVPIGLLFLYRAFGYRSTRRSRSAGGHGGQA